MLQGTYIIVFNSVSATLRGYDVVYNAYIPSNDRKTLSNASPKDCATACNNENAFQCRSFDYKSASRQCYLSSAYRRTVAVANSRDKQYDYYEMSK